MMKNQDKPLSSHESLELIHEMISRAKGNLQNNAFYFLLWGWIILAGSIGHCLLLQFSDVEHPERAWLVVVLGIIASIYRGVADRKNRGASTYSGRIYSIVWITFLMNYFIILFFMARINFYINPIILMMAASATYLSGTIIKFRPLKWGAVFIWLMAIAGFLFPLPLQLLATAAAVGVGYLIPGYMLQNKEA